MYIDTHQKLKIELDTPNSGPRLILFGDGTSNTWLYYNNETQKATKGRDAPYKVYIENYKNVVFTFGDNTTANKKYKQALKDTYGDEWESKYYNLEVAANTFDHGGSDQAATMLNNPKGEGSQWAPNIIGIPSLSRDSQPVIPAIDAACEEIKLQLRLGRTVVIPVRNANTTTIGTGIAGDNQAIQKHLNKKIQELEQYAQELHTTRSSELITSQQKLDDFLKTRPPLTHVANPASTIIATSSSSSATQSKDKEPDTDEEMEAVDNDSKPMELEQQKPSATTPLPIESNKRKREEESGPSAKRKLNNSNQDPPLHEQAQVRQRYTNAIAIPGVPLQTVINNSALPLQILQQQYAENYNKFNEQERKQFDDFLSSFGIVKQQTEREKLYHEMQALSAFNQGRSQIDNIKPSANYKATFQLNADNRFKLTKIGQKGQQSTADIEPRNSSDQLRHVSAIALVGHALSNQFEEGMSLQTAMTLTLDKLDSLFGEQLSNEKNVNYNKQEYLNSFYNYYKLELNYFPEYLQPSHLENLIKKALEIYNSQPHLIMEDTSNPTQKMRNEGNTINEQIKILNKYEWSLSAHGAPEDSLGLDKHKSVRNLHTGIAKDKINKLEPKQFLNKNEINEVLSAVIKTFDYDPFGKEPGRSPNYKNKASIAAKDEEHTRYTDEPIERLYDSVARHLSIIFTLCPKLQEQHQSQVILGFINHISNEYKKLPAANKVVADAKIEPEVLYKEIFEKRLLNQFPYYSDFSNDNDLDRLKGNYEANKNAIENINLQEASDLRNLRSDFDLESIHYESTFSEIEESNSVVNKRPTRNVKRPNYKDFEQELIKKGELKSNEELESDDTIMQDVEDKDYNRVNIKSILKDKLHETFMDNDDAYQNIIKKFNTGNKETKNEAYQELINLNLSMQKDMYVAMRDTFKEATSDKNIRDNYFPSLTDTEIRKINQYFANAESNFDAMADNPKPEELEATYQAYVDLNSKLQSLMSGIDSELQQFHILNKTSLNNDWNQADIALDINREELQTWLDDNKDNPAIQTLLLAEATSSTIASEKSSDEAINQYIESLNAGNPLPLSYTCNAAGLIELDNPELIELIANSKQTQVAIWQKLDNDIYEPIYTTDKFDNNKCIDLLCDKEGNLSSLAPANMYNELELAVLDYDAKKLREIISKQPAPLANDDVHSLCEFILTKLNQPEKYHLIDVVWQNCNQDQKQAISQLAKEFNDNKLQAYIEFFEQHEASRGFNIKSLWRSMTHFFTQKTKVEPTISSTSDSVESVPIKRSASYDQMFKSLSAQKPNHLPATTVDSSKPAETETNAEKNTSNEIPNWKRKSDTSIRNQLPASSSQEVDAKKQQTPSIGHS